MHTATMKFSKGEIICREDLGYPEGALVCDGYDDAGRLLAHPLGGGFQLTVPAQDEPRFRVLAEGAKAGALFHRGRFSLADGERVAHATRVCATGPLVGCPGL